MAKNTFKSRKQTKQRLKEQRLFINRFHNSNRYSISLISVRQATIDDVIQKSFFVFFLKTGKFIFHFLPLLICYYQEG